jgi:hypothetical protein
VILATLALAGCGSSGPAHQKVAARPSTTRQEAAMCRRALAPAASSGAKLAGEAVVNAHALKAYLSVFEHEMGVVVSRLGKIHAQGSTARTLDEAIRLDKRTLKREQHAVQELAAKQSSRLTQGEVQHIFDPVSSSESSAAVKLSSTDFPTACLGDA